MNIAYAGTDDRFRMLGVNGKNFMNKYNENCANLDK